MKEIIRCCGPFSASFCVKTVPAVPAINNLAGIIAMEAAQQWLQSMQFAPDFFCDSDPEA